MEKPNILLFIPSFSWTVPIKLLHYVKQLPDNVHISFAKRTMIHKARNIAIKMCAENWFDYLVFLDDDMIPPNNMCEQLVSHWKDMVCWVYRLRQEWNPIAVHKAKINPETKMLVYETYDEIDKFTEVANAWTGCVAISKKVCKFMVENYEQAFEFKHVDYFETEKKSPHWSTMVEFWVTNLFMNPIKPKEPAYFAHRTLWEDMIFFERARFHWFKLYCDPTVKCQHIQQEFIIEP